MRLLQMRVGSGHLDAVLGTLRDENIDPVALPIHDERADDESRAFLVVFPVPTEAVDRIRDNLAETGFEEDHLVIGNAESANTPNYDHLVERFVEGHEEEERVSNEEIQTKAHDLNPQPTAYYLMTILSALVATAGLLLDSPALVVGSMVIAPQIGAALTGSVGAALGDETMFTQGIRSTVSGLAVAAVAAALLGWGLKTAQFVPPSLDVTTVQQIASRSSPGLLTLLVALCAGAAGGVGLATELPVSIVGVAVAAATVPAAAAVGIGVAWGIPTVTVGALTLLVVNIVGIVFAGTLSLWYLGYRPTDWDSASSTRAFVRTLVGNRTTWVAIALLGLTVLGPGALLTSHIVFENQSTAAVQTVLDDPTYDSLELLSVRVDFGTAGLSDAPREVTVTVQHPVGEQYPQLASRFGNEIRATTQRDVTVNVEFEERSRSPAPEASGS
ncbi:TIGR00341 family protein [Haloferax sp. MBLA0076]|uniref:TIGR00341 family protein n=1 Tax=Haloferax litoreum TaxID=2666140 RepID=A0A6A8GIS1_9EURY|nr:MULTISPECIES: TIGR00341 family protein [Haloferax]KAB1194209.1 TIGR00341 family protein [Haloferax sp. CBA1148]MRX22769.1 TIGR00341 family protein [Haloferax litoreum]